MTPPSTRPATRPAGAARPPERPDRIAIGIGLRCIAMGSYVAMAALFKLASRHDHIGPIDMLFYRAVFGMPVVLLWVALGPGFAALRTRRPGAHIGRSALGISSILLTFQGMILLPLPLAITIGFTAPLFATLLSAWLLREPVHRRGWMAVGLGFLGVLVAVRPGGAHPALAGVFIALASAFGQGGVTVTIRHLGRTEHMASIVFWFFVCNFAVGAAGLLFFGHRPDSHALALLAAGGAAGGITQILMTASLRFAPVASLMPLDYSQIVWAALLGAVLFGDLPTPATVAGALLIVAGGLCVVWRRRPLPD